MSVLLLKTISSQEELVSDFMTLNPMKVNMNCKDQQAEDLNQTQMDFKLHLLVVQEHLLSWIQLEQLQDTIQVSINLKKISQVHQSTRKINKNITKRKVNLKALVRISSLFSMSLLHLDRIQLVLNCAKRSTNIANRSKLKTLNQQFDSARKVSMQEDGMKPLLREPLINTRIKI